MQDGSKLDEQEWRRHYELLKEAQRLAHIGSWELDLTTYALTWSDEIFRIFEVDPEKFGASYEAFVAAIHPEDRALVDTTYQNSVRDHSQYMISHRLLMPDGRLKYVRERGETFYAEDGTPIRSIGTVQDISEISAAEAALQRSEAFSRTLTESMADGVITIDQYGTIETCNPATEKIFGYPREELVGKNVRMLMPEPHRGQHDGYLASYCRTGEAKIIGKGREVVGQRKDGSLFALDLAVSEMRLGERRLFAGIVRDITERKRMEQVKDEFIAIVSHELRTPLTSIRGSLALVLGTLHDELPERAQALLDIALRNSERLTKLINDLLDLQKISAGKMPFTRTVQPLMPIVEQALAHAVGLTSQYKVSMRLTETLPAVWVRVDGERLTQVLMNFLSNAAKFSPEHGEIEVSVRRIGNQVRVAVRDHGPGIPPEFHDQIFQKFSQADASDTRAKGGTGLGLAISKSIVEQMAGTIGFESPPGDGATFFFLLPEQAAP